MTTATTSPYLVLHPEDHVVLGEAEFGMPGLVAVEAIGPPGWCGWSTARATGSSATRPAPAPAL
jgi:hypothetical protein